MYTKEVCNKTGLTPKSLRIYEEKGLVTPQRDVNGYRKYSEKDMLKLREILLLKELGFSLHDIKILINKNTGEDNMFVRSIYFQKQAITKKILALKNIEKTLENSIHTLINDSSIGSDSHFETMEKVLEKNNRYIRNWVDNWNFDSWAIRYDQSVLLNNDELKLFQDYKLVLKEIQNELQITESTKILDLGCGTGNLTGLFSKKCEVYGIDQSLEMLLQCKEKYPYMKLRLGNFLDHQYIENTRFDYIVSTYAFHHLTKEEKEVALDHMQKSLKPEGKIIIGDLMFLNNNMREERREEFILKGREDLWEVVEEEFYGNIEEIKQYVEERGIKFSYRHFTNFTWILIIGG